MSTLEQIVRPAQVPNIRPLNFAIPRKQPKNPSDNLITWGNAGNDIFTISAHLQQDIKPAEWEETKRTYDAVRIQNPDDTEQHVDAEAMTEYQSRNRISKDRYILRFAKQEDSESVKVLSRGNVRKSGG